MIRIPYDALVAAAETGPEAPRPAAGPAFVVWYLRGRGQYGRWHDTVPFGSKDEALAVAQREERRGYPCVVLPLGAPAPAETDPHWWDFGGLRRTIGVWGHDFPPSAPLPPPVPPASTCIEHAYGTTTRLSFQIKVF